jgi:hypothetical protein
METARNLPHQNVMVTQSRVKALHKQQTSYIYKAVLKPISIYGIHFWVMASTSNIEIVECFQSIFAHDSGHTLVRAEYGYVKGSANTNS